MAIQQFLARINGFTEQVIALVTSTGAADAGKIIATNDEGKIDPSLIDENIGIETITVPAKVALEAGEYVSFFNDAGTLKVRLADNTLGAADGFVKEAVALDGQAKVFPLDILNDKHTALTIGSYYWLGTAGAVTDTPLDETNIANKGKYSQLIGKAISATSVLTKDHGVIKL